MVVQVFLDTRVPLHDVTWHDGSSLLDAMVSLHNVCVCHGVLVHVFRGMMFLLDTKGRTTVRLLLDLPLS